jgi:hypothetical protein
MLLSTLEGQKGNPVPGGYNWATLFRGDINTGTWPSNEFCGASTQEPLLWQGPEAIVQVNYRPVLSSERALQNNKAATV